MNSKIFLLFALSIFLFSSVSATILVDGYFQNDISKTEATINSGGSITLNAIFTSTYTITSKSIIVPSGLTSAENSCTLSSSGHTYSCVYTITANNVGIYDIGITGTDSKGSIHSNKNSLTLTVTSSSSNHAPVITSNPVSQVDEGQTYNYPVTAADEDGDALTYSLVSSPDWLTINTNSGLITGTAPQVDSDTNYDIIVGVSDGTYLSGQAYTLRVYNINSVTNHAPVITSSPVKSITEGNVYNYQVDANDADRDYLTYSLIDDSPGWLTINPNSGLITGTAPQVDSNTDYSVVVEVSDGNGGINIQSYTLRVKNFVSGSSSSGGSRVISDSDIYYPNRYFDQFNPDKNTYTKQTTSVFSVSTLFYLILGIVILAIFVAFFWIVRNIRK